MNKSYDQYVTMITSKNPQRLIGSLAIDIFQLLSRLIKYKVASKVSKASLKAVGHSLDVDVLQSHL